MPSFSQNIKTLIARNQLDDAISSLIQTLENFKQSEFANNDERRRIEEQAIVFSARWNDLKEEERKNQISPSEADREQAQLYSNFVDLVEEFPNFPDFSKFLYSIEEEEAWKKATMSNRLDDYEAYFKTYPNGKYKEETEKVMEELREIKDKSDHEIKETAAEERTRREQKESGQPGIFSSSPNRTYLLAGGGGLLAVILAFVLFSNGNKNSETIENQTIAGIDLPAYVICVDTFATEEEAMVLVNELSAKGYQAKSGYFWIPDIKNLNGSEQYQVYVGPYKDKEFAVQELCRFRIKMLDGRDYHGILLDNSSTRSETFQCADRGN